MSRRRERVFVGVGSSIDPEENVEKGLRLLGAEVELRGISTFYRSPAEARPGDPPFLNGVVEIRTRIEPRLLKERVLRAAEVRCGRRRGPDPFAPRTLDLDLLLYGDRVEHGPGLILPDPAVTQRAYAAQPLFELVGNRVVPGTGERLLDVLRRLGEEDLEPLPAFTRHLRRALGLEGG